MRFPLTGIPETVEPVTFPVRTILYAAFTVPLNEGVELNGRFVFGTVA